MNKPPGSRSLRFFHQLIKAAAEKDDYFHYEHKRGVNNNNQIQPMVIKYNRKDDSSRYDNINNNLLYPFHNKASNVYLVIDTDKTKNA